MDADGADADVVGVDAVVWPVPFDVTAGAGAELPDGSSLRANSEDPKAGVPEGPCDDWGFTAGAEDDWVAGRCAGETAAGAL